MTSARRLLSALVVWSAVGAAHVVLRPGTSATRDELIAWVRERLANFKVPRDVVLEESLPRNASGKVLKTELRQG